MLIHNSQGIGGFQAPGAYPNLEITFCALKKMVIDVAIFIVVSMLLVLMILLPSSDDSVKPPDDCLTIRPQSYLFTIPFDSGPLLPTTIGRFQPTCRNRSLISTFLFDVSTPSTLSAGLLDHSCTGLRLTARVHVDLHCRLAPPSRLDNPASCLGFPSPIGGCRDVLSGESADAMPNRCLNPVSASSTGRW